MIYTVHSITDTSIDIWDGKTRDEFGKEAPMTLEFGDDRHSYVVGDRVKLSILFVSSAPDEVPNEG